MEQPKKPLNFAQALRVRPGEKKVEEVNSHTAESVATQPDAETPHHSPPVTTTPHQSPPLPIRNHFPPAPARDFNKRANSLEREAMPQGLFPGSSKKIYDALYLRSRGAHPPRTRVRASRHDFLNWTDVRNLKTVDGHLRYLMSVGLIVRHWERGSTEGSEYEVRLPEELPPLTTTHHHSPGDTTTRFLGSGHTQNSGSGGYSQTIENIDSFADNKTYIKTNTIDDDEALRDFHQILIKAVRELTGQAPAAHERERWAEVGRVLVKELKEAAAKTEGVSSVPAFLAEHLKRRLSRPERGTREGKRATKINHPPEVTMAAEPSDRRLNGEEIAEQSRLIAELLESGYTIEQAEAQFKGSFHPDDWTAIINLLAEKHNK